MVLVASVLALIHLSLRAHLQISLRAYYAAAQVLGCTTSGACTLTYTATYLYVFCSILAYLRALFLCLQL